MKTLVMKLLMISNIQPPVTVVKETG